MTNPFWKQVARLPRHNAMEDAGIQIQLIRQGAETVDKIRAELRDVSREGLQLVVECQPLESEQIHVRIGQPNSDIDLQLSATVCWIRPEGEAWAIGCQFAEQLEWEAYGELFMNGILEAE